MREEYIPQQNSSHPRIKSPLTFKFANYLSNVHIILLLLITFTLGYFSASFTNTDTKAEFSTDHFKFPLPRCGETISPDKVRSRILNAFYDGVSPYKNFPPPHLASLLRPTRLEGWGSSDSVFANLIKKVRPRTIVEVGTFLGASATHMADVTRQLGLDTQILCVDDFRGWAAFRDTFKDFPILNADVPLLSQFMQNVITANSSDFILPVPFPAASGLDKLCELGVFADIVEIDAAHDFHSAWDDINRAYKLLGPGGVMFGHDYFNGEDNYGVRRAIDLFARFHGFKIVTDNQHWVLSS